MIFAQFCPSIIIYYFSHHNEEFINDFVKYLFRTRRILCLLKPRQTVNAKLYCKQLDQVNQSFVEKYPTIFNRQCVNLQHNSARPTLERYCLISLSLQHFLNGKKFENSDDIQNVISRYFTQNILSIRNSKFVY